MNLLEKLRPFYQDKLAKANVEYPEIVSYIVDELESKKFVMDLTYGCIMSLRNMTDSQGVVSPYEFFNL